MKNFIISALILLLLGLNIAQMKAQTSSASDNLIAQPIPDRSITYSLTDAGVSKPIIWGLDLAWLSEANVRRGLAFMGSDRVDVIRSSFIPTDPIVNGELTGNALSNTNLRLNIINTRLGSNTQVVLNCDHPSIDPSFSGNAANWAELIDITTRYHQEIGRTVVTVSPFNEPDNSGTGQGTMADFYNIAGELRNNSRFDNIRISGGNTLNCDQALPWYNYLKARLDEGNTHQLAGSFDNYASFYQTVRANGDHATNDELHNVMEAMVGVEYGLQSGIWWSTAELARGEFVKASDGVRLGYAEHRPNWTAASVYRSPSGKVQAFGGTSERQALTTTYRFISKDKDVYYNGYGPQREYTMVMPGGTAYQTGQTNAEQVVNITWGDDIQPIIDGQYVLVNRNSGKVMEVAGGSSSAGANLQQNTYIGATFQQWNVTPVDSRIGGDFSYFTFTAVHSGMSPDILNWSLDNGGSIITYNDAKGANQQWYLEYIEDGWFYIRSRWSAKCMDVYNSSTADAANIVQWDPVGGTNQQWRFIPVGAPVEFDAPVAPSNLTTSANAESISLNWTASSSSDVAGYTIFRSESASGSYNTIASNVTTTSFVDNTTTTGGQFYYSIKAVDNSLNRSNYSNQASATATGINDFVAHYQFDGNTDDNSINLNHCATHGDISYPTGNVGSGAIALNGTNAFIQLPATLANQQEITIATWVNWNGGGSWQRIFDFGNNQAEYLFLTPSSGSGLLHFGIKNGGSEQVLTASALTTGEWVHVAVSLSNTGASMYINGEVVAESSAITISPLDIKPVLNYIGRSQWPDPLLNGSIDDFRVYNYALSASEIGQILGNSVSDVWLEAECGTLGSLWNVPSDINASNDQYVTIQPGNNSTGSAPSNSSGYITYDFNMGASGTYNLWARVITPNVSDDSFWIKMDGGSWFLWNQIGPNNSWIWEQCQSYNLSEGNHTLTIAYREDGALLDKLYIGNSIPSGEGSEASNCSTTMITTLTIQENETGFCSVDGTVDANQSGYTGSGFANTSNSLDNGISWTVNIPTSGNYAMNWRYANGGSSDRLADLLVDGSASISGISFPSTGSWTSWAISSNESTFLNVGNRVIRIQATTSSGLGNVDYITISGIDPSPISCIGVRNSKKIDNVVSNIEFKMHPNPTSKYVTFSSADAYSSINLTDLNGKSMQVNITQIDSTQYQLDISNLKAGVYLLYVKTPKIQITRKVIKLNSF